MVLWLTEWPGRLKCRATGFEMSLLLFLMSSLDVCVNDLLATSCFSNVKLVTKGTAYAVCHVGRGAFKTVEDLWVRELK